MSLLSGYLVPLFDSVHRRLNPVHGQRRALPAPLPALR
jgi:hypothetical protein